MTDEGSTETHRRFFDVKHPFSLILSFGLLLRIIMIWGGLCDLYVVADDAYYYFTIVRNLTAGFGVSFDTITQTNGFHPLYLIVLTPISALAGSVTGNPWILVHAALTLCALLDVLTGVALASLLPALVSQRSAVWGIGAWMLGPWSVLLTLRGLESSLTVFILTLWLLFASRHADDLFASKKHLFLLGLLYGLAFLARTDNAILLGAAIFAQWFIAMRGSRVPLRRVLTSAGLISMTALAVASPWLLWNLLHFDSSLQSSVLVKLQNARIYGTLVDPRYPGLIGLMKQITAWIWVPARFIAGEEFHVSGFTWIVIGAGATGSIPALIRGVRRRREFGSVREIVAWGVGAYFLTHIVVYTLFFRTYATWYAAFPILVFSILAGVTLGQLQSGAHRFWKRLTESAAVCLVLGVYVHFFFTQGVEPHGEENALESGMHAIKVSAPGKRVIGAYNAGALGYFAPSFGPYIVVNLDGLVNNRVREEWKKGRSAEYILTTVDVLWIASTDELDIWLLPEEKAEVLRRFRPEMAETNGQTMVRFRK